MHVPTGQFVPAEDLDDARAKLELKLGQAVDEADVVMVDGTLQQVQQLGERVRLGAAEQDRRRKRRKQQRASRVDNR